MLTNLKNVLHNNVAVGLVAPVVGQTLMGETGEVMVALMILMAVTSTGSAEVIAVTSILVYDIYQVYLKVSHVAISARQVLYSHFLPFPLSSSLSHSSSQLYSFLFPLLSGFPIKFRHIPVKIPSSRNS